MSDFLDDRLAALGSTPVPPLAPAELIRRRGEQRRARGRLVAGAAGLALVVAAGATAYGVTTDRDDGALQYAPQPSGRPSPAPSATPSATPAAQPTHAPAAAVAGPPADGDVVLAVGDGLVTRADGTAATTSVSLYRLRAGSASAEPVRTLAAPRVDVDLAQVSVSAGPTPTTCVIWHLDPQNSFDTELRCYRWGDSEGTVVRAASGYLVVVALSADGRSLAWANGDLNPTLWVGRFVGTRVTDVRAYVGDPARPAGADQNTSFTGLSVSGLSWAGPSTLAISVEGEREDQAGLRSFVPGTTQGGWLYHEDVRPPSADLERGYGVYGGVRSATSTTAWALERPRHYEAGSTQPDQRAVEVALPSGRVKEVVSEPADGRFVIEVSGGSRAVVYMTAAFSGADRRVYVRYPGESRGNAISGLPYSWMVVAGP